MTNGKGERELPCPTPFSITTQWRIQESPPPPTPYFQRKPRPEGPKKRFLDTAPAFPLSEGLNPPLPPDEKLVGMGTTCLLHRFVQSRILHSDNEWSLLPRFILNVERRVRDSKVKAKYSSKVHFQRYPTYQCVKSVTWDHYKRPMTLTNPRWFSLNGNFKIQRRDGKRTSLKTIGLIGITTTLYELHTFLYLSLPFLHDYDVKMLNFMFYGRRQQATTKSNFSSWTWIWSLGI